MVDSYAAPWPRPALAATSTDLSDAEFVELDELLAGIPEPLDPLDVVMLDGFLCGVIVQPELLTVDAWLPYVFDAGGHRWGEATPEPEQLRARALIERRHAALNRSLAEFGGFDPFVLEPNPEPGAATEVEPGADPDAGADAGHRAATTDPVREVLAPWVIGFEQALHLFPGLVDLDEPAVETVRSHFASWLPDDAIDEPTLASTEPEASAKVAEDGAEPPSASGSGSGSGTTSASASLDAAIGQLVAAVADLYDLTAPLRYKVEAVRRDAPKVGRNEPCPCGSGRKFKQCHGARAGG